MAIYRLLICAPLLTNYPVQLFANQKVTLAEKMADGKEQKPNSTKSVI